MTAANTIRQSDVVSPKDNMTDCRAYLIDHHDRIVSAKELHAGSDEEALSVAQQFVDGYDVLWSRDRW
jgi:hypothetical protein